MCLRAFQLHQQHPVQQQRDTRRLTRLDETQQASLRPTITTSRVPQAAAGAFLALLRHSSFWQRTAAVTSAAAQLGCWLSSSKAARPASVSPALCVSSASVSRCLSACLPSLPTPCTGAPVTQPGHRHTASTAAHTNP
jgi:hypothetical protein